MRLRCNFQTPASTLVVKKEGSRLLDALDKGASSSSARASGSRSTPQHTTRPSSLVRVKPEPSEQRLHGIHSSPISTSFVPQTPSPQHQPVKRVSSLVRVKPEAVEPEIARKRPAATPTTTVRRPKLEQPLFPIGNTLAQPSAKVEDLRAKILEIQPMISHYEDIINRLDAVDGTPPQEKYQTSIPNVSPLKRTLSKPHLQFTSLLLRLSIMQKMGVEMHYLRSSRLLGARICAYPAHTTTRIWKLTRMTSQLSAAVMQHVGPLMPYVPPLPGADNYDENGDFHGRGCDTCVGPQAKADERMVEKENNKLKGGCLGDDMGLGKVSVGMLVSFVGGSLMRDSFPFQPVQM
ncbi:hypothetical protein DXG03_008656 [Asterophora parasitica]|uniref:Uncharacterized protein n=1 Tax=Asterophora parasitica TaxID=117018 RepID=A0A9P7G7J1_9AGAR|nr:hypothetical protein DXG03_008656 [Asterophora parasitica]